MSFTVSARVSERAFAYQHPSMLSALERSLSLLTAGMSDVRIVDGEGGAYTPASLHQALFGRRIAAPAADGRSVVLPLAA